MSSRVKLEWPAVLACSSSNRQRQQTGMAFIHVKPLECVVAERAEYIHASHAEDNLLAEAVMRVAPVQPVCQRTVPVGVFGQIGVQQVDRNHRPRSASDIVLPGAQLDRAAFKGDRRPVRQLPHKILHDPLDGGLRLPAAAVEGLVEVTLAVQQCDGHHR
jgi:hypothetical protein